MDINKTTVTTNREYKSDAFKAYFSEKKNALELYNALNGTAYTNEDDLEINSIENAVFLKIYNDVSFVISGTINLYEHQSTVNPNMPLRDLFYVSDLYKPYTAKADIYGKKTVRIPTPKFVVFYNGTEDLPDKSLMKLSDSFMQETDLPELELIVTVLNVNNDHNKDLMEHCAALRDYATLIQRIRDNLNSGMGIEDAVTDAVDSCIKDHIMEDFLIKDKAGVINMHVLDFNEELHNKSLKEEGFEEGEAKGKAEGVAEGQRMFIMELLKGLGTVTVSVKESLDKISDEAELTRLFRVASKATSIQEFEKELH